MSYKTITPGSFEAPARRRHLAGRWVLLPCLGAFAGLLAGTIAAAALALAMGTTIAGCACITIATFFVLFGMLTGLAVAEG